MRFFKKEKPVDYRAMLRDLCAKQTAIQNRLTEISATMGAKNGHVHSSLRDLRASLIDELTDVRERIMWTRKQLNASRIFADYFMDVCRRDLDQQTFSYLFNEAQKMKDGELEKR